MMKQYLSPTDSTVGMRKRKDEEKRIKLQLKSFALKKTSI